MKLLAICCPNGLGHLRRVLGLCERLVRRHGDTLEIEVVCERWQLERLRGWEPLEALVQGRFESHLDRMVPGVTWRLDPSGYTDESLFQWEQRVADLPAFADADLVISDNLAAVAAHRPDVVLTGSFLWSETLREAYPDHAAIRRFAEREREVLSEHRPPMLCVADLATAGVVEQTRAVPLAWMCEADRSGRPERDGDPAPPEIGIATGASSVAERRVAEIASGLRRAREEGRWAGSIAAPIEAPGVKPFRYRSDDYRRADLILCRPGAGALTQCVAHGVPALCVREPGNPEMAHNARRFEALGLGRDLGEDPPMPAIIDAVESALQPAAYRRFRERLVAAPKDGLDRAADWLTDRISGTTGRLQDGC